MRLLSTLVALAMFISLAPPALADEAGGGKSESVATGMAIGGTLAGPALLLLANQIGERTADDHEATAIGSLGVAFVVAGPSLGHWYARKPLTWGMPLRLGGVVAGSIGLWTNYNCVLTADDCGRRPIPIALMVTGGAALLTGTAWDLLTADDQVRRWNARHAVTVAPVRLGARGAGMAVAGSF